MTRTTTTWSEAKTRDRLRRWCGAGKYRITRDGEIHIYGRMPGSIVTGWYLYGWVGDPQTMARIEALD